MCLVVFLPSIFLETDFLKPSVLVYFRSEYRPIRERRDFGRRSFGSMTREQWQQNRSSWSGGSGVQNQAATANAVNLLVGLSKILWVYLLIDKISITK